MQWYDLINTMSGMGFGLPDDPTDVLCVEIGIAQVLGTLTQAQAIALANLQPAASRVWRSNAVLALGGVP